MSSSEYSYNAPQFYSSLTEVINLSEEEDNFFDAKEDKEKDVDKPNDVLDEGDVDVHENKENVIILSDDEDESLNDSLSKIKIRSKFDGIDLTLDCDRKSHPMLTRQDISILSPKLSLELRSRSVLKKEVLGPNPVVGKKRKAEASPGQGNCVAKYRSLAEAIYHFQRDTPPRFRGVSKKLSGVRMSTAPVLNPVVTVPETPNFLSQNRLRHCSEHCLTHEERELQEIEEAKQQFKPQQLNKKIFDPLKEVDREKHFTVPKPFKLTKPHQKKAEEQAEVFVFRAKPLPQKIYSSTESLRVSFNRLPVLMEESEEVDVEKNHVCGLKEASASTSTKIKPFSFDERDKLRAIRKLENINKIIESEKKAAVFKAQPLPSYLAENINSTVTSSSSHHKHETEEFNHEFKARPASVLHKKPFQVKKSEKNTTKILDIKLNTELRAQQRQAFDHHRRLIETEREIIDAKLAEEEEIKNQEELSKLRKEIVHKPIPLPKNIYNEKKHSSDETLNEDNDS